MTTTPLSPLDALIDAEAAYAPDPKPITVDGWLRDHSRAHVTRMLRNIAAELAIEELLFPPPIADRIADRAAKLRGGESRRRYRGAHRVGAWSADALIKACIAQRPARAADHRRALRRPFNPLPVTPVFVGERMATVRWFGVVPGAPGEAIASGTLTMVPDNEARLTIPALMGCDDAPTGPILTSDDDPEVTPC